MAANAETLEKARIGWSKLDINQKMIIIITIVLFVIALVSLVIWVSRPSYGVLFSNLSPEDTSAIVTKLKEQKIPYQLNGASIIEVPSDKVYETRIALAGEGLPQGGTVGFEIFNQSNFGMSDFQIKVNYRRALEGELARTISQINEVNGARVHIVLPEQSLYSEKENPATASVIIKPKAGVRLAEGQIQGVVNLIARSVEGLKPENITVVDTNGNVLSDASGDGSLASGNYSKTQLDAKERYEANLEKSIGSMLGTVLGSENNAVVRVSADLDFSSKETEANRVEQGKDPVVISRQTSQEKFEGQGSPPGGIPGLQGQTPGATTGTTQANSTVYPQGTQGSGDQKYQRKDVTENIEVTRIKEHTIEPPGNLKKLSVAVVVNNDGSKPIQNNTIEGLVAAAAGIDKTRGDVLTVSSVPFDTEWVKKEEKAIADAQKQEMYGNLAKYAIIAILLIAGLFVLMKMVSGVKQPKKARMAQEEFIGRPISSMSSPEISIDDLDAAIASDITPEKKKEILVQQRRRQVAREELQNLAKERPADVAQLLKIWLNT